MTTEDYISFETAKLLKEKGFKIPYDSFRGVYINGIFKRLNPGDGYGHNFKDEIVDVCSLQMAMKWLREVHKLEIYPYHQNSPTCDKWWFEIVNFPSQVSEYESNTIYTTYEEACEDAIKYCLKNI